MPEVGIGFFPDVGATYALPRLADRIGTYLALTGERIRTADLIGLGLATRAVRSSSMTALREDLTTDSPVDDVLAAAAVDPGPAPLDAHRPAIAGCFSADSVSGCLARLDAQDSEFARKTAATIRTKSPTSLVIAFEQMRRGAALSFEEAMKTEFRIVSRICEGHDFYEGVRATIIDKDGAPRWRPATLEGVTPAMIEAHFAPLGSTELEAP